MENLLKTEGLPNAMDTINNKQLAKISFLQQEVKQQLEYITDLKYMLKLNKEAMRILLTSKNSNSTSNDIDKTESTSSNNYISSNFNKNLVEQLFEENHRLTQSIENLIKERNIAQSKALISQQIAEEAENHCVVLENELEEKIIELKRIIQDKEFTIQDLEKTTPIPLKDGNFMLFKEIMSPNEKVLKLSAENDNLMKNLNRLTKSDNDLRAKLDKSCIKIKNLKQELLKIRFSLTNPMNISRLKGYIVENLNAFSDEEDIELLHNYYNVRDIHDQRQNELKEMIEKKRSIFIGNRRSENHYYGDKKKVNLNIKDKNLKDISRIEELQNEIVNLQKSLERESINSKLLLHDLETLKKTNENLIQTNETLLNSINITQTNIEKLQVENSYYKEYFYKYVHVIKHKSRYSLSKLDFLENNLKFGINKMEQKTPKKNNNILQTFMKNDILENSLQLDLKTSKTFLINLAKEFYLNTKIRNFYSINQNLLKICDINNNQIKPNELKYVLKPKRCLSNPLLYISESTNNLYEELPNNKRKRFFKKSGCKKKEVLKPKSDMERMLISPMPSTFDFKTGNTTPFLLDISKINPFNFEHSFMD